MQIEHLEGNIEQKLPSDIKAFGLIYEKDRNNYTSRWVWILLGLVAVFLFLPWTQNIRSNGFITTVYQNERPQEVNSQIPGKILKWYVKEGDFVKAGDTLLQLGEVKDDYLDPDLALRTREQIRQNEDKASFYQGKIAATERQIANLEQQQTLKMDALKNKREQIERKLEAKKAEWQAAIVDAQQSKDQLERARIMFEKEAISKFDLERRNATYQKAQAALTEKRNEVDNLNQDLLINTIDQNNTIQEYSEKIAKASGDRFSSSGEVAEAREKAAALSVKEQNIIRRAGFYFLLAPQSGQIVQAKKSGINEMVKEGEMIVEIVPESMQQAVEIFVNPMDLPLISKGQKLRFMFDGHPAIVFSGWPSASYGTFGGKVMAIESNRSVNGKFRILVARDSADRPWPSTLRLGAGAVGFALLKNVPVWYELWRNINGFPPEFYRPSDDKKDSKEAVK